MTDPVVRATRKPLGLSPAVAALAAAAIAVAIQSVWIPLDADVSWLISVCERVLAGDRLYVDILEVNPPASVWMYLPAVWAANLIGAKPEVIVVVTFLAAGFASAAATVRMASRLDDAPRPLCLMAALAFVVFVLPMGLFAQREHAALLLAIPALTSLAVIGQGKSLSKRSLYANGIAAGLIIIIKPYFLAAIIAPAVWAIWKRRSLSPLLPGATAAVASILLYGMAVLLFARAYFEWLDVIVSIYGSMHTEPWKMVVGPTLFPALCLALALVVRAPRTPSLTVTWSLGSFGFVLAAIAQGKNYPNHWLPGTALALLAIFVLVVRPHVAPLRRAGVGGWLALVTLAALYAWAIRADPAVASAIQRVAPPQPKIIALSPQLITGHPVTRNVGGQWIGSRAALYIAKGATSVGLNDPAALRAYRDDLQSFADDVRHHSPDVVLVHKPTEEWLMNEPVIAEAMGRYRRAASAKDTDIWLKAVTK